MNTVTRLQQLESHLTEHQLDAVVLNAGANLTHITGLAFHLMERPVIFLHRPGFTPLLVFPELESAKARDLPFALEPFPYPDDPDRWQEVFNRALSSRNLIGCTVGIEPRQLRMLEYRFLRNVLPESAFTDASEALSALRIIKDDQEITAMQHAVEIAEKALLATVPSIKIGMREDECATELVVQLLRHGSDPDLPFFPIVASGPNSANPHAHPGERRLAPGDLLVIDWGARWQGYTSDLTRTFAIGTIHDEEKVIYETVRQANAAGRSVGRPGLACSVVDTAAREIIEQAGFGPQFTHRTGHGLGRECHEAPYLHNSNQTPLQPGMTYTIEPGIYISGRNGVRIEDDIVVTGNGCKSLSSLPRELSIIG